MESFVITLKAHYWICEITQFTKNKEGDYNDLPQMARYDLQTMTRLFIEGAREYISQSMIILLIQTQIITIQLNNGSTYILCTNITTCV